MKTPSLPTSSKCLATFALAVAGALAFTVPAPAATPSAVFDEEVSFSSGHLDWGLLESFRCELVGPEGQGQIELSDGATRIPGTAATGTACARSSAGSEAVRFPVIGDYYDPETDSFGIQTEGAVRFSGYPGIPIISPDPTLDITVRDIYVTAEGDEGSLLADVEGVTPDGEEELFLDDATLVDLDLSGVTPAERADGVDWSAIPASLTEEGAEVFGSSEAGDTFDPVSISANVDPFELEPDPDTDPVKPGRIEGLSPVRAARAIKVARAFCLGGESPCGLIAPGRVAIKGGGRNASVRVKYPYKVGSGKRGDVRFILGRNARKLVRSAGKAKAKLRLTLTRDGQAVSQVVRVQIRR